MEKIFDFAAVASEIVTIGGGMVGNSAKNRIGAFALANPNVEKTAGVINDGTSLD